MAQSFTQYQTFITLKCLQTILGSLALPVFDYTNLAWGDKSMSLMNNLQVLQNKARKIIPHRPFYLSATDVIVTLKWLNLEQRIFHHHCTYFNKFINGLMDH